MKKYVILLFLSLVVVMFVKQILIHNSDTYKSVRKQTFEILSKNRIKGDEINIFPFGATYIHDDFFFCRMIVKDFDAVYFMEVQANLLNVEGWTVSSIVISKDGKRLKIYGYTNSIK